MQKTIIIKGKPFTFEQQRLTYEDSSPISEENARALLTTTKQLFNEIGLDFYLSFGTLLGAIREHGLIKGDEDVDIFITDEQKLIENLPYLNERGYKIIRAHEGNTYSFKIKEEGYIDVYILRSIKGFSIWSSYCYSLCEMYTPKSFFKGYEPIEFLGVECMCPKNPEKIVEFWYGKSWRTPIRGHKFYYEVKSHWYWLNKIKPGLQTIIGWPYWRHLILRRFKTQVDSLAEWKRTQTNAN